jgi:hypothetical protein
MPPNNQYFPNQTPAAPVESSPVPQAQGSTIPKPDPKKPKSKATNSTQNSLLLSEIRDNMVIMADGSFRAIVACKSINFDLMSSREREGVEYSYQNFLNALTHPIQILVRSQRIDIGPYIDRLIQIRRNQDNMLLNVLMDDYINFIDVLSQEANIMDKSFFIAIPYYSQGNISSDITSVVEQSKGFFNSLFAKPQNAITKIDTETYEKAKTEIKNRVDSVMAGLFQIGIQSVQLNTKELGEMYYNFYNPDTAVREPLGNFEDTTALFVKKGQGNAPTQQGGML